MVWWVKVSLPHILMLWDDFKLSDRVIGALFRLHCIQYIRVDCVVSIVVVMLL